ncbi:MAG: EutN/CcmL family microcompartment protein [Planctomycetaceae bacterium]|nr:EutN/CcmL family microcompartment protein [Planctomycetaceae bacterium]
MRIGEVIGGVTLSQCHPTLVGASWRIVVPLDQQGLRDQTIGRGEPFVMFDELGSGNGSLVAVSDGAEASAPFHPDQKPIDAYCAALLDAIMIEPEPTDQRFVQ